MKQHSHREEVRRSCRSGYEVRACTDFPRERLECHCEQRQGVWVLEGRATVDAVIHVGSGYPINLVLLHERTHVGDLEAGLRAHLAGLESRRFGSKAACETFASVLSGTPHLRLVMNRLRSESNEKYGCSRARKF